MFAGSVLGLLAGGVFTLLLGYACASDLRTRRIPNRLVVILAVVGLAFSEATYPFAAGILRAFGGMMVGLAIWMPFWLLRWLGAGDVKLFAAAGAWLGAWHAVEAAVVAALAGAVLSLGWLAWQRGWRTAAERMLVAMVCPRVLQQSLAVTTERTRHVPYGVALAIGLVVTGWWPSLLF